ncbi:MAG: cell division protein FtsZ, partial [Patescibacteria group bacterium]
GSGGGPVVAAVAKEIGALTVAVVTKPFSFEGPQRRDIAEKAWENLARNVDAIITIPNEKVLQIVDKKTSVLEAFKTADDILRQGVQGIAELITIPGEINVDFADVKAIMRDAGSALMGIGLGTGENRAAEAAKAAISSPLLEVSIDGARGILLNITGGPDLTMSEVNEAARIITSSAADDAKIIFGFNVNEAMTGSVSISVIATGFDDRRPPAIPVENETNQFFSANKFSANNFLRKQQKEDDEEEKRFKQQMVHQQPRPETIKTSQPVEQKNEDDDLEIPAFIRKKMGI